MTRHAALIVLPTECLISVLRGEVQIVNIPDDGEIVRISYDYSRDALAITVVHPSFPACEPGSLLVEVPALFQSVHDSVPDNPVKL